MKNIYMTYYEVKKEILKARPMIFICDIWINIPMQIQATN